MLSGARELNDEGWGGHNNRINCPGPHGLTSQDHRQSTLHDKPSPKSERCLPRYSVPTSSFMIAVIFGSALLAMAMTSSSVTGFNVSGKHSSVRMETPNTLIPM
jgi:hypothetical protein